VSSKLDNPISFREKMIFELYNLKYFFALNPFITQTQKRQRWQRGWSTTRGWQRQRELLVF